MPAGVSTIHFGFFADRSNSGLSTLPDALNDALLDQFVNQSPLRFSNDKENADATLEGAIVGYTNRPVAVTGLGRTEQNEITVTVQATFRYKTDAKPVFSKTFTGTFQFDPNNDPINGENNAARQALNVIARNLFTDSLGKW